MKKTSPKLAEGLGLAALAAGAAATYFFYGKGGKQRVKRLAAWSNAAKQEMVKKIKQMEKVSKTAYDQAAKEVLAKYKQAKNINPKEVEALGKELKTHWKKISGEVAKLGKAKTAKKPVAKKISTKRKK